MGSVGGALSGSWAKSKQDTQLDATTEALNRFRLNFLTGGEEQDVLKQYPELYRLSGDSQGLLSNIYGQAGQGGLDLNSWYQNTRNDLGVSGIQDYLTGLTGERSNQAYTNFQNMLGYNTNQLGAGLQNYLSSGRNDLNSTLQQQLGYGTGSLQNTLQSQLGAYDELQGRFLGAGNNYMNQVLGPQIANNYALMGLARSGGRQEAEAKGAASISLPIAQQMAQLYGGAYGQYGQGLQNLNNQAYGQYGQGLQDLNNAAYGQYNQNMYNLGTGAYGQYADQMQSIYGQNYGAQANLAGLGYEQLAGLNFGLPQTYQSQLESNLGRTLQGFQASMIPQQWQQMGLENWRNAYLSGINSTPYTPERDVYTKGREFNATVQGKLGV